MNTEIDTTSDQPGIICHIPLRWGDMDAYGHVNNARIVSLLEEARVAAFGVPAATGAPSNRIAPVNLLTGVGENVQTLIAEHTIRYRRQLEYRPEPVRVRVFVTAVKGASVEIGYEIADTVANQLCVTATTTMVFADRSTGRPVRLTDTQRETLAPYVVS